MAARRRDGLGRRDFLGTLSLAGAGYFVAAGSQRPASASANEELTVACIGVGGKGGTDSTNASRFGRVIAICDVDRTTLASKGDAENFTAAERFTDYRELFAKHGSKIDMCTVTTPDHMHAPITLEAMRQGISCYTQKPLTRSIYEARLLARVAAEMADKGVVTQMGNQGTALDSSREAIAQLKSGVLGPLKAVYSWSDRPVWAQGPGRRMNMRRYQTQAMQEVDAQEDPTVTAEEVAAVVADLVTQKQVEVAKALERVDWKSWLGVAPWREYWPAIYHAFQHRGWWDFGSGALGDMACHQLTVPFAACGLRDPVSVVARTTGHDFDSFPASSVVKFEFPATAERPAIPFFWHDRKGNKPPREVFEPWGIDEVSDAGVLIVGEKGAFYSTDDYCAEYELKGVERRKVEYERARNHAGEGGVDKSNYDVNHMYEFFRAKREGDPKIAQSNFVDRAGPLTETILLGNLAVWAASQGGPGGELGDWGEKVEWDARNLRVTNLDALKTPRVADLIKPVYSAGYRLD